MKRNQANEGPRVHTAAPMAMLTLGALACVAWAQGQIRDLTHKTQTNECANPQSAIRNPQSAPGFVVHEWGTFVSMQGSDGVTLDGLHHEEADLPSFVFSRTRDQIRHLPAPPSKLETPVIYFYAPRRMQVNVRVDFPRGVFTQWFPDVTMSGPRMQQQDLELHGGFLNWRSVELHPAKFGDRKLPAVAEGHHYAAARAVDADFVTVRQTYASPRHLYAEARAVDADFVTENEQSDRFLFYRGLGRVDPLLHATLTPCPSPRGRGEQSKTCNACFGVDVEEIVNLKNASAHPLEHLIVMRVSHDGTSAYAVVPRLNPGEQREVQLRLPRQPVSPGAFTQQVGNALASHLMQAGLFAKEATAMVNTWRQSYFHTEGVRVLYLVPQKVTDEILPLHLDPRPSQIVRVMVGRLECLTPERERAAATAVRDLVSSDETRRNVAFDQLMKMGRFAEPVLRRVAQSTSDDELRARCERLINAQALEAIRIAAKLPVPDPLSMQARLASSYRQLGMQDEARRLGAAVLTELNRQQEPRDDEHEAQRRYFRALSLAYDGAGDDARALEALTKTVRFAARINERACQSCHSVTNAPLHRFADLRDWWGRSKFIEVAKRTGKAEPMRKEYLERILNSVEKVSVRDLSKLSADGKATRLMYLYLCDASGKDDGLIAPQTLWKRMLTLDQAMPRVASVNE